MKINRLQRAVLEAVRKLEPNAYGSTIMEEVQKEFRYISYGSLYVAINRLEESGLVVSWYGDPTPERGNCHKRFVKLTDRGIRELYSQRHGGEVVLAFA